MKSTIRSSVRPTRDSAGGIHNRATSLCEPRHGNAILLVLVALWTPCLARSAPIEIGEFSGSRAILLAIDDQSLPLRKDLCLYLSKPTVRDEPVLRPSPDNPHATDGVGTMFYGTVLQDGGKFRMWYYGIGWKKTLKADAPDAEWSSNLQEGPICYAESTDGLHWTKPSLHQVEHNGGNDNNAIFLPDTMTEGAFVIKDDADPDPSRRYKMIYEDSNWPTAQKALSPDGIRWSPAGDTGIEKGLEPSSFYRHDGLFYIGAHRPVIPSEGGHVGGRQGFIWVSTDFDHWLPHAGESFLLPEPQDPSSRGGDRPYVQVHLGVGAVDFGNVLVGIYCQWHAQPNPGDWFGNGTTYGDFGLLVSNDGQHFREPVKGYIYLDRRDSPGHFSPDVRFGEVLTQSGNGIINVGDETRIYHGRWLNAEHDKDYYGEIALATLPRDRWGALGLYPHSNEGSVWSCPIILGSTGARLTLNGDGLRGMTVEIADESFHLLPEFSGSNAGIVSGADGLERGVSWSGGKLDSLAGKKVRLLFHLQKGEFPEPRLYAAYLSSL